MDSLLWDVHRRVRRDALPDKPIVLRIELADVRGPASRRYLLLRRSEVSLCTANPGFPEELCLRADRRTLIGWWRGDLTLSQARGAGLVLEGRPDWIRAFPNWFERYMFADVAVLTQGVRPAWQAMDAIAEVAAILVEVCAGSR